MSTMPAPATITLRQGTTADIADITTLFWHTIQAVNIQHYTPQEVDDWSSWHTDHAKWAERIAEQYFVLAWVPGQLVGFASLAPDGYIDFMFTHHRYQRQGVGHMLLAALERKACQQGNTLLYSDVSITARLFFEHHGFVVKYSQHKMSRHLALANYRMEKPQPPTVLGAGVHI